MCKNEWNNFLCPKYYVSKYLSNNSKYKAVTFIVHFFNIFQALRQRIAAKRKIHISNDVATAKKNMAEGRI